MVTVINALLWSLGVAYVAPWLLVVCGLVSLAVWLYRDS